MRTICILFFILFTNDISFALNFSLFDLSKNIKELQNINNLKPISKIKSPVLNKKSILKKKQISLSKIKKYRNIIDNYVNLIYEIRQQIYRLQYKYKIVDPNVNSKNVLLDQEILKATNQLIEEEQHITKEYDNINEINNTLLKTNKTANNFNESNTIDTHISNRSLTLKNNELLTDLNKIYAIELETAKISANYRKELSRMRIKFHQLKIIFLCQYLQKLHTKINNKYIQYGKQKDVYLIQDSLSNKNLSKDLHDNLKSVNDLSMQEIFINKKIIKVQKLIDFLREKSLWSSFSNTLSNNLKEELSNLPEIPKYQDINSEVIKLKVKKIHYENLLRDQEILFKQYHSYHPSNSLTNNNKIYLSSKYKLINLLIASFDSLIIEMNNLKIAKFQLIELIDKIKYLIHQQLFWSTDINQLSTKDLLNIINEIRYMLSFRVLYCLKQSLMNTFMNKTAVIHILLSLLVLIVGIILYHKYNLFLNYSANKIGNVTQDRFDFTIRTVLWSILISIPIPLLWRTFFSSLENSSSHLIIIAISDSLVNITPILIVLILNVIFTKSNGLFVMHFRWSKVLVQRCMNCCLMTICVLLPLLIMLITLDNLEGYKKYSDLSRLCFILICFVISICSLNLKKMNIPLYLNKKENSKNFLNYTLWNIVTILPLISAGFSIMGYLSIAKIILLNIEISNIIWFALVIIYHIIRRWMLIQHRRLSFNRAKQKRAEILANRARNEEEKEQGIQQQNIDSLEIEEPLLDLDIISAQSLKLVRWFLMLIGTTLLIFSWSKIRPAFIFFEDVQLWDMNSLMQNGGPPRIITLGAVLIASAIFIITMQLVRNMPALLELILLRYLDLRPSTNYAISTLTKYLTLIFGGLIGLSLIGVDWSKLQWLIAALGVGLGFGLQEIFANFVSGLIVLFERPIRIGDTVTIRDLTGSITKINTRATTITDWDRKEIIVPNKAFITEQFVNWSLSDSVTRVVLTIPTLNTVASEKVTNILKHAANCCSYVLKTPPPEAFLVDLQHGIQLFEIRVYSAEMGHRMPLRHELHQLILEKFEQNNILIPFPPFQIRIEEQQKNTCNYNFKSSTNFF
ncbi:MAG: miniconductance mechanosensitive channel MscM [Pantoea sp. Brub]|nr:miniconductance mechanosensitive channel MscM [Pantoea sp. Brub]